MAKAGACWASGFGTVFSVSAMGGTPTVLASFTTASSLLQSNGLVLSDNTLGGPAPTSGTIMPLATFNSTNG